MCLQSELRMRDFQGVALEVVSSPDARSFPRGNERASGDETTLEVPWIVQIVVVAATGLGNLHQKGQKRCCFVR